MGGVWALWILEISVSDTHSSSSEHCWFVPGKVSCLLLPPQGHSGHFTSLEPAPCQLLEARVAQNSSEPELPSASTWALAQTGCTHCVLPAVAPSVEAATAKLLPMEKKGPKSWDLGLTVTLGAEEEDCKMCTITSTRHTEIFSLLCEAHIVSDLCLRAELAQNASEFSPKLWFPWRHV